MLTISEWCDKTGRMNIPTELFVTCPICGVPLVFDEDNDFPDGWQECDLIFVNCPSCDGEFRVGIYLEIACVKVVE